MPEAHRMPFYTGLQDGNDEMLRDDVRAFLCDEVRRGAFVARCDAWLSGHDPAFSRRLGARGWLGVAWPRAYGGGGMTNLARYTVVEELLAAGAPVAAHWMAERQVGPSLLRNGTEEQRRRFLPRIAAGTCFFAIGLSEPDSGSDLASISARATRLHGGWSLRGRKVWTSHAHRSHYLLALCRTSGDRGEHDGMTQFVVDLRSPGVEVRPIRLMSGEAHFCEVALDGVRVGDGDVLGSVDAGWSQAMEELAFERSGPERFLSPYPLLVELLARLEESEDVGDAEEDLGHVLADLMTLRTLSRGIAAMLDSGRPPGVEAAMVKDLGTAFERRVVEVARRAVGASDPGGRFAEAYRDAVLAAPGFTVRGGTTEVMRGIVARGLGA